MPAGHTRPTVNRDRSRDDRAGGGASGPAVVPGARDVRASLNRADGDGRADACIVACPPHPRAGGSRSDPRLRAVAAAFRDRGVDRLRVDYTYGVSG